MIVRVMKTGKDAAGLTRYLFGPGKTNEHTNQRIVAGSTDLAAEWSGHPLTYAEATHLGRVVESAWRRQYAPELALAGSGTGGISRNALSDEHAPAGAAHVFHAALALRPGERLTDDQWQEVATKYVEAMGFAGDDESTDCSWFAVNHGLSEKGNDHVHIVVCTTRRDGTRADIHNSGRRSQEVRRDVLEKLPYVSALHDAQHALHDARPSSYTAAEHNIARERGWVEPERVMLQRIVRSAATQATTEAAFINTICQNARMDLEAVRWEPGSDKQIVTGYKVRMRTASGEGTWFSASKLAPDLTLSKLRSGWTGETDDSRSYARALWAGTQKPDARVRPQVDDAAASLEVAATELAAVADWLERLDPADRQAWLHAEAAVAGATAVMATAPVGEVDDRGLATGFSVDAGRASDVLTRHLLADLEGRPALPPQVPAGLSGMEVATRHIQLAARAAHTDRYGGWIAVMQQLTRTVDAIARARDARAQAVAAETLRRDAAAAMTRLEAWTTPREWSKNVLTAKAAAEHATAGPKVAGLTTGVDAKINRGRGRGEGVSKGKGRAR